MSNIVADIVKFNELSGNARTIRGFDHPLIKLYKNLIEEETQELSDEFEKQNLNGTLDALADTVVVSLAMIHCLGFDPEKIMNIVNSSNLSKFCNTLEEAVASVEAYDNDPLYKDVCYIEMAGKYIILGRKEGADTTALKILKASTFINPEQQLDQEIYSTYFSDDEESNV